MDSIAIPRVRGLVGMLSHPALCNRGDLAKILEDVEAAIRADFRDDLMERGMVGDAVDADFPLRSIEANSAKSIDRLLDIECAGFSTARFQRKTLSYCASPILFRIASGP